VNSVRISARKRDELGTGISPVLERALGNRLGNAGVRDLVAAFPTRTSLHAAGPDHVRATIARCSPRLASKTAEAVAKTLAAQDVTVPGETATRRVIAELAAELDRIHARSALGEEIEEAFLAHPFGEVLASLPGTRPRTGAGILAEIGDGSGFASDAKLAAYVGLAPMTGQSGLKPPQNSRARKVARPARPKLLDKEHGGTPMRVAQTSPGQLRDAY
jgi:hypothetical protein